MTETRTLVPGASHPKSIHQIELFRVGPPGSGGGFERYEIQHLGLSKWGLYFQNKPCETVDDVNGITNEVLLLAVIDRLECYEAGQFACEENASALALVCGAMEHLNRRTANRAAQGVEGKHEVHTSGETPYEKLGKAMGEPKGEYFGVPTKEMDARAHEEGKGEEDTEALSTEDMAKKSVDDAWDTGRDADGQPNPPPFVEGSEPDAFNPDEAASTATADESPD